MSLKVKLFSCIAAFVLVLSMLFVGVYAAQSVELNVGGNVSFTASSVYADITGSYVGTVEHPSTAQSLTPINIDAEDEDGEVSMPSDWTSMPLNFDSSASPITVTITIENLATDRAIAVSLTDNTDITGVSVARTYNSSSFSDNTSSQTITGGQTGTFTFTLSVTSQNNDISGTFDLDLNLTNSSTTTTEGYNVTFINNSSTTVYVRTDNNVIQTVNSSETRYLNGYIFYLAFSESSLNVSGTSINSVGEIVLYAPGTSSGFLYNINVEGLGSWGYDGVDWYGTLGRLESIFTLNLEKDYTIELENGEAYN